MRSAGALAPLAPGMWRESPVTARGRAPESALHGRERAIHEIIVLLEDALRRCDGDALNIAAIHIDHAIHECRKTVKPPDDKIPH